MNPSLPFPWAIQTSAMTPESNSVLLNSPRQRSLALAGKFLWLAKKLGATGEKRCLPSKGPARARDQPTRPHLTPLQPRNLRLKRTNQGISHRLRASLPQGTGAFRTVSHERGQEFSYCVSLQASEHLWMFCQAWADPCRTWLQRKGEGKRKAPPGQIHRGPLQRMQQGRTPLAPTAPPVLSRHTQGTRHTGQPKGDVRGGREQAGTDGEGAHLGETKAEGTGAFGSPPPRPRSTSTRTWLSLQTPWTDRNMAYSASAPTVPVTPGEGSPPPPPPNHPNLSWNTQLASLPLGRETGHTTD